MITTIPISGNYVLTIPTDLPKLITVISSDSKELIKATWKIESTEQTKIGFGRLYVGVFRSNVSHIYVDIAGTGIITLEDNKIL